MTKLSDLAAYRLWCNWRNERRTDAKGRETIVKVPYGAGGAAFQSNNPNTWTTLAEAERSRGAAGWKLDGVEGDGVGIALGPLDAIVGGEAAGWSIVGVDLDTCIGADGMAPWAVQIVEALGGYWEISPSGTGVKCVALMRDADKAPVMAAMGLRGGKNGGTVGKMRVARGSAGASHPPGIEAYLGTRYFAVTWDGLGADGAELGVLDEDRARRIGEIARTAFGSKAPAGQDGGIAAPLIGSNVMGAGWGGPIGEAFAEACRFRPKLAQLAADDRNFLGVKNTDSDVAWVISGLLKDAGWDETSRGAVLDSIPVLEAWRAKNPGDGGRQRTRALRGYSGFELGSGQDALGAIPASVTGAGAGIGAGDDDGDDGGGDGGGTVGTVAPPMPPAPPGMASGATLAGGLPLFSDEVLARIMADRHAEGERAMRHVAGWGKWMAWDGVRWREDETLGGTLAARAVCADMALNAGKEAKSVASAHTVRAVESLARADARLAARTGDWDADPWALNTPGGIVDLKTGRVRSVDPYGMFTRATRVAVDLEAHCPQWMGFLDTIMAGDQDLIGYLQRLAGYCLTGVTIEDALFFLYGGGDNGKSTFIDMLTWTLGEEGYSQVVMSETFEASRNERHSTELARLRGARLVSTSETQEGKGWNEARIKAVTGGSPITAHFMRQDYFTFTPEFKVVVSGNHKPRIRTPDVAMRRRMNLVPFDVRIPEGMKDKDLSRKLQGEGGAVLAWMVRGCLEWQRIGLRPPVKVAAATDAYMAEEDSKAIWFAERVIEKTEKNTTPDVSEMALFEDWNMWAKKSNEHPGQKRDLAEWLRNRGHERTGTNRFNQKTYVGLTIRSDFPTEDRTSTEKPPHGFAVYDGGKIEQ